MKKIIFSVLIVGMLLISATSFAQEGVKYPIKPIDYIVQFAPGGGADITSRMLCKIAEGILGQPIVVENKAGGAGAIGINLVAKAKPDGYTIGGFSYSATVIGPHIREIPFKTKEDFSFICQYAEYTHAFVVKANAPWKTFKDFIEDARKNPGRRTYCSAGAKSGQHIYIQQIAHMANVNLRHIPYAGDAEELAAVLGGHVDAGIIAAIAPHMKTGSLRALAVDSQNRWKILPDVPTFKELGFAIEAPFWIGVAGPKGIPNEILRKLEKAFEMAAKDPSFDEALERIHMLPAYRSGEEFKKVVFRDYDIQGELIKKLPLD
jgi:tripartite-type tricarboxylate transporter receptor subunit TctC